MADVVCLGILVADVVGKPVEKMPDRGKLDLVDALELHTGGCASNTGTALAKLGVDTAIIGKVGDDGFGDFMISELSKHGADCSGIVRDRETHTSATMVLVHGDGERSFIHYIGANAALTENDVDFDLVRRSKILHVAGTFLMPAFDGPPTANVLQKARQMGVITSLDTCWDSKGNWMKLLAPCLPHLDYLVPSIEEARMITGQREPSDIADALLGRGVGTVALKMGEDGCYIKNSEIELRIPIYKVEAVDATGAGDAFAAGFLAGIVNGWNLLRTGKFANAVGAFCVTAMGATAGIKDRETIEAFIAQCEGGSGSPCSCKIK